MTILLTGLVLWTAVHWFPAAMPAQRDELVARFGEGPYKGIFSVLVVVSIVLIIVGWKGAPIVQAYLPPLFGNWFIAAANVFAFVLFFAARIPNNLRRIVRHPQLTGVLVWGAAHLLVNGQVRDVLFFGGLSLWSLVGMFLASQRDGQWQKPEPVPVWQDAVLAGAALSIAGAVFYFHGYLFGVAPIQFR